MMLTGYLMTNLHTHRHSYECVDQHAEYISGHNDNTDGALFYFLVVPDCEGQGKIGHCPPPYDAKKQLTCVVCSK